MTFTNRDTLCLTLSWSHYRLLMRIPDQPARDFYTKECAKSAWSVRQLERQIHTIQDIGQMQMYVNYYTRELMNKGDTPPIGIVLCAEKNDAVIRYTLPENNSQIFASKYFTYLPTEEELKRELCLSEFHKLDEE